jgi:Icc-related predicted phosphoesterase
LYNKEASGGEGLLAYVKEREPDLLLCGHIHEDRGEARLGRTRIVNAGELRRGSAAIVDIEIGGRIEVKWI